MNRMAGRKLEMTGRGGRAGRLLAAGLTAVALVVGILAGGIANPASAAAAPATDARAHWIDEQTLAWPADLIPPGTPLHDVQWTLDVSQTAQLGDHGGDRSIPLTADTDGLSEQQRSLRPELSGYLALHPVGLDRDSIAQLLTAALQVRMTADGAASVRTGVQLGGVLDDVFAAAAKRRLGVTWESATPSFALWAPTAQQVRLLLFEDPTDQRPSRSVAAERRSDGTWTIDGSSSWAGWGYLYEVTVFAPTTGRIERNVVTDPYSVALTVGSTKSVLVDLADGDYRPEQWRDTPSPVIERAVDRTIYELHVRDFSIADERVPEDARGTYEAFTADGYGRRHLQQLAAAGLNTVHLLPTFDIASIEEDRSTQREPDCDLDAGPDWAEQQDCVMRAAGQDGFNWGYDPLHFMAPEGSYAVDPSGGARIRGFRDMVGALHADGLQVVLDVVFNHTAASGQDSKSVLDRIVPGYYQRLDAWGAVETSTCCQNLATERRMSEKLMVDSLVLWAREYKVDGFRFDLMAHSSRDNLLAVRAALDELTLERDGVDGSSMYLYGEGWTFGEVAGNARFVQASQGQLGGTGIGTFNDRLRDAVHGGSPGDHGSTFAQGFGTGLATDPNGEPVNGDAAAAAAELRRKTDLVKLSLAGNLRDFTFETSDGSVRRGDEIDFGGAPAGYADEPDEVVNYVDAHDNETLFDLLALKLPRSTPMAERVRMNTLALATTTLSQTPSLWHAGTDLLRSKSLDRNSYDSGDWFNAIDWSGERSNFGVGLPPERGNGDRWQDLAPLLRDEQLRPTPDDISEATQQAQTLLELKRSSRLFRLGDADLIRQKLTFPVGGPDAPEGVVVMQLDDLVGPDVDPELEGLFVVFNATPNSATVHLPGLEGREFGLSPIHTRGADERVLESRWESSSAAASVPARTVAVFVDEQTPGAPPEKSIADGSGADTAGQVPVLAAIVGTLVLLGVVLTLRARSRRKGRPVSVRSGPPTPSGSTDV